VKSYGKEIDGESGGWQSWRDSGYEQLEFIVHSVLRLGGNGSLFRLFFLRRFSHPGLNTREQAHCRPCPVPLVSACDCGRRNFHLSVEDVAVE
jgi:hypothetical protein